jgi:hypothetical protein
MEEEAARQSGRAGGQAGWLASKGTAKEAAARALQWAGAARYHGEICLDTVHVYVDCVHDGRHTAQIWRKIKICLWSVDHSNI